MSSWKIVVPVGSDLENFCANPSFETNTTSWTAASGATLARSTVFQSFGAYSLAVSPSSASSSGAYFATFSSTNGSNYYARFDFSGSSGALYRAYFGSTACAALGTSTCWTGTGSMQTISASWAENSTTTRRFYVQKNGGAGTTVFYIDGLLISNTASLVYFDGDQPNCYWQGTAHGSKSTAKRDARNIGQVRDLYDAYGLTVKQPIGAGTPPYKNTFTDYGIVDGANYQRTVSAPRVMTLMSHVTGSDMGALHAKRKALIDIMRAGKTPTQQPFTLRYTGNTGSGSEILEIDCILDGGLEFTEVSAYNEFPDIRLIAPDPNWRDFHDTGASMAGNIAISSANYILQKAACGLWGGLGAGMDAQVQKINKSPYGIWFVGGNFSTASGGTACGIAQWDGSKWSAVTGGATSGISGGSTIMDIQFDASGSMYVTGNFTSIGGTTANRIARWNQSSSEWSALSSSGLSAGGNSIAISPCNNLFVVGDFLQAGSISACRIAFWDGTYWYGVYGTTCGIKLPGLQSDGPRDAKFGPDNNLYIGGGFDAAGGVTACRIAKYSLSTGSYSAIASGLGDAVENSVGLNGLYFDPSGTLYVGGDFVSVQAGTIAASGVTRTKNGTAWEKLTSGSTAASVRSLASKGNGGLLIGGNITSIGGIPLPDGLAEWNGTTFAPGDIDLPGTGFVNDIHVDESGVITIGFTTSGTASAMSVKGINNGGTADAYPIFKIVGPSSGRGKIWKIVNVTTGDEISFNYSVNAGETVTLDLSPGKKTLVSSYFANVNSAINPGDSTATFRLIPGVNNIGVFCGDGSMTAQVWWRERHEGIDGGAP